MQAGRRLYFHGQYATCKQGEDLPSPLSEHLQRFGNWTWHPKFLPKSVNCTLQWIGIWLGKIYQLDKNRSLARICARWRCAHPIAATRHSPQNPTICGTHVIQTYDTPIGFCQVIFVKPLEMRFNLTCQKNEDLAKPNFCQVIFGKLLDMP